MSPLLGFGLVLGLVSVGCLCLFRLWENPPQWRMPRQTEGGIFHRLTRSWTAWFYPSGEYVGFQRFVLDRRDAVVMRCGDWLLAYCGKGFNQLLSKSLWFRRVWFPVLWWISRDYLLAKWELNAKREGRPL